MKRILIACLAAGALACESSPTGDGGGSESAAFSEEERLLADQIISVFENNTPEIDYAYAENLDDGRGITAGRAGFTSATGDMLEVIERYTEIVSENDLAAYIPRLIELAAEESGEVDGLEGLEEAWAEAAGDPIFCEVQDEVVDDEYYWPAVEHADALGLVFPLTLLNIFDTCIQHGDGEDPDGLPEILRRATEEAGGAPADSAGECEWLRAFMDIRRSVLLNPSDPETQEEWAESVGRVDALRAILDGGNVMLIPPVEINPWGTEFTLPQ